MSKKVCTFAPDFTERKRQENNIVFNPLLITETSPGGGMVDTVDSKSAAGNGVRVQVPPGVQEDFVSSSR